MREALVERNLRHLIAEARGEKPELDDSLPSLFTERKTIVNLQVIGDGIERLVRFLASLRAQKKQGWLVIRSGIGIQRRDGVGGLIRCKRRVRERLQRLIRHNGIGILIAKLLEFRQRVRAVAHREICFREPVKRIIAEERISLGAVEPFFSVRDNGRGHNQNSPSASAARLPGTPEFFCVAIALNFA